MTGKSIRILTVTLAFLGVLFLLQPAALADPVKLTLTQPPGGNVYDGIYLSPYYGMIGTATASVPIICDDFFDDTYIGEQWQATVANGSAAAATSWQKDYQGTTLTQDYDAIAYLAQQLLTLPQGDQADQALDSFAIWDIFDDTGVNTWLTVDYASSGGAAFYTKVNNAATSALNAALTAPVQGDRSILTIYTPTGTPNGYSGPPQQFVTVSTPEASSLANLAVDLLLLAGAVFFVCRRRLTSGLSN